MSTILFGTSQSSSMSSKSLLTPRHHFWAFASWDLVDQEIFTYPSTISYDSKAEADITEFLQQDNKVLMARPSIKRIFHAKNGQSNKMGGTIAWNFHCLTEIVFVCRRRWSSYEWFGWRYPCGCWNVNVADDEEGGVIKEPINWKWRLVFPG